MHYVINITGGVNSGKEDLTKALKAHYENLGFYVLSDDSLYDEKKRTYGEIKESVLCYIENIREFSDSQKSGKHLFISFFGIMDLKVCMENAEFIKLMRDINATKNSLFELYDAVFYIDTKNDAAAKNHINVWTGHNHLRMIDFCESFSESKKSLTAEIDSFLGEPIHFEIEKKFIINYPDISYLESLENVQAVYISQTYIVESGEKKRIRKRGIDGEFSYYLTIKKEIDGIKKLEEESRITRQEYESLYESSQIIATIEKTRYCLSENNTYYEIDIYPFWSDKAIMEIELKDENEEYVFPKNIEIISDVSSDKSYSNYNLAKDWNNI